MEPGDQKQLVPGELTEDGHAASGFQLGLWSVLEPFLPVVPCVVLEHTAGPRLPPTNPLDLQEATPGEAEEGRGKHTPSYLPAGLPRLL